jgi:hypothetical protein
MSKRAFQVGDRVRHRSTSEEGIIVRVYFDLKSTRKTKTSNYIIALHADGTRPAREALWHVSDMLLIRHPEK